MKKIIVLFVALFALAQSAMAATCDLFFTTENLCLEVKWELKPTKTKKGTIRLTFTEKGHPERIISPKMTPFIQLWMTSMGHGSSPVTLKLIEDGVYRANDVFFIMGGPWDIRFQLKDGTKVVEQKVQKITI